MKQAAQRYLLLFFVGFLIACSSQSENQSTISPDNDQQSAVENYFPSLVVQWNEVMLAAVRSDNSKPTVITRAMFMVHTAMYDAWSVYDAVAEPVELTPGLRRFPEDRTVENKEAAISQAAFHTLVHMFPQFEADTGSFETMLNIQGYAPDYEVNDVMAPSDIGLMAAQAVINSRKFDGSNQQNDYADSVSTTYPDLYQPVNDPITSMPGAASYDQSRWQPLRVPTGAIIDAKGNPMVDSDNPASFGDQIFTTPHWGSVTPFALSSGDQLRPPPPPMPGSSEMFTDSRGITGTNDEIFKLQVAEVLEFSANLTDEQKVVAEYWADGPRSETPPGHWNALAHGISERDKHTIDEDIKFFFALNCALFDAGVAAWEAKRYYDYVRPISAIHHEYGGKMVKAWGGPNEGTQFIRGEDWQPYQQTDFVTPPFAEYVSGHSSFSAAAATVFTEFTGSNRYYDGETVLRFSDFNADGVPDMLGQHIVPINGNLFEKSPSSIVVLTWETFQDAADEAGLSRLYGGIHFADGDLNGRTLGYAAGELAYDRAASFWLGAPE
ncbi:MAG: vanadium-dependent haloperoxidase [Chloroflexota bacterium]